MNEKKQAIEERSTKTDRSSESVINKDHENTDTDHPLIDFSTFIFSLSTAAQFQLGKIADPETGKIETNLPLAKQTIDILAMVQEKTKGNLVDGENKLLDDILHSLRSGYNDKMKNS